MKFRPVVAKLFYADRQTDRHDESISCFSKFSESAYKLSIYVTTTS